jgi:hypothetical protein
VLDEDDGVDEPGERDEEIRIGKKRQVVGILVRLILDFIGSFTYELFSGPATGYYDPFPRHWIDFGNYDGERIQCVFPPFAYSLLC